MKNLFPLIVIINVFQCFTNISYSKAAPDPAYISMIQEISQAAHLPLLNFLATNGAQDDVFRLWIMQGENAAVFIVSKNKNNFTALRINYNGENFFNSKAHFTKLYPQQDWPSFWQYLKQQRAFDLPDSSLLKNGLNGVDVVVIVLEYRHGEVYRICHYSDPWNQPWPEAKHVVKIVNFVTNSLVEHK